MPARIQAARRMRPGVRPVCAGHQHRRHGAVVWRRRQHRQRRNHGVGKIGGKGRRVDDGEITEENKTVDRKIKSICRGC